MHIYVKKINNFSLVSPISNKNIISLSNLISRAFGHFIVKYTRLSLPRAIITIIYLKKKMKLTKKCTFYIEITSTKEK